MDYALLNGLIVGALIVLVFLGLAIALWRGNLGLINFFPQDPDKIADKDRKSMGRAFAGLMMLLMLFALFSVFGPMLAHR